MQKYTIGKHLKKSRVITNLLLIYVFCFILMLAINLMSYFYVRSALIEKEKEISATYLKHLSKYMDAEISAIQTSVYNFLYSNNNNEYLAKIGDISSQYNLSQNLRSEKLGLEIADKLLLYSKDTDIICSDEGIYNRADCFCELYGWSAEENARLNQTIGNVNQFTVLPTSLYTAKRGEEQPAMIIISTPSYMELQHKLVVTVSRDMVQEFIGRMDIFYNDICMIDDMGRILYSVDTKSGKEILDEPIVKLIKEKNASNYAEYHDNLVVYERSDFFDGCYLRTISNKDIAAPVQYIIWFLGGGCLLFILVGIVLAPFFVKTSYAPIYNIVRYYRNVFNDKKDMQNEYSYIIDGLERLRSENNVYSMQFRLFDILKNGLYSEELKAQFPYARFAVGLLKYHSGSQHSAAVNYLEEHNGDMRFAVEVSLDINEYAVVLNADDLTHESALEYFEGLRSAAKADENTLLISVSDTAEGCESIYSLYKHAVWARDCARCVDVGEIFWYSDNCVQSHFELYFPDDFEDNIRSVWNADAPQKVEQIISAIIRRNKEITFHALGTLTSRFMMSYTRLARMCQAERNMPEIDRFFEREYRLDKIEAYISKIFREMRPISEGQQQTLQRIKEFSTEYIDAHYHDFGLNIDMIADALNMSASYVSKMFKQATGTNFSEYLLARRMEEAKLLLTTTDLSVKQISERVGLGTYNSFVRSFTKRVGVSPGRYRKGERNH